MMVSVGLIIGLLQKPTSEDGARQQTCHFSRVQGETPAIALPNVWHELQTFAFFANLTQLFQLFLNQKLNWLRSSPLGLMDWYS